MQTLKNVRSLMKDIRAQLHAERRTLDHADRILDALGTWIQAHTTARRAAKATAGSPAPRRVTPKAPKPAAKRGRGRPPKATPPMDTKATASAEKIGRKLSIVNYLKEHGPASRVDLLKALDIPVGTLSVVLNDKTTFQSTDGMWTLV